MLVQRRQTASDKIVRNTHTGSLLSCRLLKNATALYSQPREIYRWEVSESTPITGKESVIQWFFAWPYIFNRYKTAEVGVSVLLCIAAVAGTTDRISGPRWLRLKKCTPQTPPKIYTACSAWCQCRFTQFINLQSWTVTTPLLKVCKRLQ